MRWVQPKWWPPVLASYLGAGIVVSLARLEVIVRGPVKPVLANVIALNLALPALALVVGAVYPRFWTALAGGVLLPLGFVGGTMLWQDPAVWRWTSALLVRSSSPLHVGAAIGCAAVGAAAVGVTRPWRRVGAPPEPWRCAGCGYALRGLRRPTCPECGAAFDPAAALSSRRRTDSRRPGSPVR
jgi:hypothetical protein